MIRAVSNHADIDNVTTTTLSKIQPCISFCGCTFLEPNILRILSTPLACIWRNTKKDPQRLIDDALPTNLIYQVKPQNCLRQNIHMSFLHEYINRCVINTPYNNINHFCVWFMWYISSLAYATRIYVYSKSPGIDTCLLSESHVIIFRIMDDLHFAVLGCRRESFFT